MGDCVLPLPPTLRPAWPCTWTLEIALLHGQFLPGEPGYVSSLGPPYTNKYWVVSLAEINFLTLLEAGRLE